MPVYVDALRQYPRTRAWPYGQACHLWADTVDELHAFARRIGMKQSWFQHGKRLPHYDLTAKRRALAVSCGAVEASLRAWLRDHPPIPLQPCPAQDFESQ